MAAGRATIAWWVPEESGGIRAYADLLFPEVRRACEAVGFGVAAPVTESDPDAAAEALARHAPGIVHVQHEHGLFGRRAAPPFSDFPRVLRELRRRLPGARIVATAHTVPPAGHRLSADGHRAAGRLVRAVANRTIGPHALRWRDRGAFGALDGVLVHSALQVRFVRDAGCALVRSVPMFVPPALASDAPRAADAPSILVFGYVHPAKGQDLAIAALAAMRTPARLVLAGAARLPRHREYAGRCARLAERLGVAERVTWTGFVPEERIADRFAEASLVLAPFRETTGSFTLARAFAQGAAVLASDLPLDRELAELERGAPALFRAGDAADCARRADEILGDAEALAGLRAASLRQAAARTAESVSAAHVAFYREAIVSRPPAAAPTNG